MMTPISPEHTRCLAHPHPTHPLQAPRDWCPLRADCARHETIRIDAYDGSLKVLRRVCGEDADQFLAAAKEEE